MSIKAMIHYVVVIFGGAAVMAAVRCPGCDASGQIRALNVECPFCEGRGTVR